jgi:hypothetical protein
MNLNRPIPDYFVKPRNTVIQIIFTALFTYSFILIYHPFGSRSWFDVNTGKFAFGVGFVVVLGMVVVIVSRVIMTQIRKHRTITIAGYALLIALEVLAMTGFYMMIQKVFVKDPTFWFEVYYTAILNATLILLIPYLISLLYFAWLDKKQHIEKLMVEKQSEPEPPRFVPFRDENGETKLTIQLNDILYLEASENYVTIHYLDHNQTNRLLLRNSMKRLEEQLSGYSIVRTHRSYMVNLTRVKLAKKTKTGMVVDLVSSVPIRLPVSEKYKDMVERALRT